mgnify:CR=1 FL=1
MSDTILRWRKRLPLGLEVARVDWLEYHWLLIVFPRLWFWHRWWNLAATRVERLRKATVFLLDAEYAWRLMVTREELSLRGISPKGRRSP